MVDSYLKKYVKKCTQKIARRYKKHPGWFGYESDFHADLYFLLNHVDMRFWDTCSVELGSKPNFHGIDLVINNPDNESKKAYIEIKYYNRRALIKHDLERLAKKKGERIFIYFGDTREKEKRRENSLQKLKRKHKKIHIFYIYPGKMLKEI